MSGAACGSHTFAERSAKESISVDRSRTASPSRRTADGAPQFDLDNWSIYKFAIGGFVGEGLGAYLTGKYHQ